MPTEVGFTAPCPCGETAAWTQRYFGDANRPVWIYHCGVCGNGQTNT